jgi:hypothetical protein
MDDRSFPYPRFLKVPFMFVPDGCSDAPEVAQWKADHSGWVTFRATFVPRTPEPGQPPLRMTLTGGPEPLTMKCRLDEPAPVPEPLWAAPKAAPWPQPQHDPPPSPLSEAEAEKMFRAARPAAYEAATRRQRHALKDQHPQVAAAAGAVDEAHHHAPTHKAAKTALAASTAAIQTAELPEVVALLGVAAADAALALALAPTTTDPGEEQALRAALARHGGAPGVRGFEPPTPSPPLPGLVPPSLPKRKPGEGGFTPPGPGPALPGFTPAPPSAPVRPGPPAVANKPIVLKKRRKSKLPPARSAVRRVRRFNPAVKAHATGAEAERRLTQAVQSMPNQEVIFWGDPIGSHGADVVSVNIKTGEVTLWDAKYRSNAVRLLHSSTSKRDRGPVRMQSVRRWKRSGRTRCSHPRSGKRRWLTWALDESARARLASARRKTL